LLLAFSALSPWALAGGQQSSSQATSSNAAVAPQNSTPPLDGAESIPPNSDVMPRSRLLFPVAGPDLALGPDAQDRTPVAHLRARPGRSLADVNGDVCYTLRTYMVKPAERTRDDENSFRGYSECETASTFQIRSAEAHPKKAQPDEAPATLK